MRKSLRFYIALWGSKAGNVLLKILKRNASYFPGKFAVSVCPDFIGMIDKPETIIAVTGTNGKTTVSNMIEDVLKANNYDIIDNSLGSNVNSGVATTLIKGANLLGKTKKKIAVLEIDERSANKVYPYLTPTYLICTNLFRDSMIRNAHSEFIAGILNKYIPKETKLILNGDDLISCHLAEGNKRVYFGIDRLDTDTDECQNIVRDIVVCPKCNTKLKYDYVRYNHIGRAHCPKCDYGSPEIDYEVTNLDIPARKMTLMYHGNKEEYDLIRKEPGKKAVILILDDFHDAHNSSENITWHYDTDYEFLNDNSIKQVITAGARHWDTYIRLELAGVPEEKIVHTRNELDSTKNLNIKDVDTVFILYDIYTIHLMNQIKKDVEKMANECHD